MEQFTIENLSFRLMNVGYRSASISNGSFVLLKKDFIQNTLRRHLKVSKSRSQSGGFLVKKAALNQVNVGDTI